MDKRIVTVALGLALAACRGEDNITVVPAEGCAIPAPPPAAAAGTDRTVGRGVATTLDGSASIGHRDAGLSYSWRVVTAPQGSGARLSSETSPTTSLTPDAAGVYVIGLTVDDGCVQSPMDTVSIVVTNAPPVANAGADQAVGPDATVQLDGSASSDPEHDALTFRWTLATRPAGSSATLSSETSPVPGFTADVSGVYVAVLVVHDGTDASIPDAVTITVGSPGSACGSAPAIADAGPDATGARGEYSYLNGSGSSSPRTSYLTYKWSLQTVPAGSAAKLSYDFYVNPSFRPDLPGVYVASLIVHDSCGDSLPDTVTITVPNGIPVADAGPDRDGPRTGQVALDGSASHDPDGDPLTYSWQIVSRPEGSSASLSVPNGPRPILTIDVEGTYVVSLVVSDRYDASVADTITVTAANRAPIARIVAPLPAAVGETVTLDGQNSSDPDHDPITYSWILTAPAGSTAVLSGASTATPSFTFDVDGPFRLTLTVSDGSLSGSAATFVARAGVVRQLPFDVVDAKWSDALDRLVLATTGPNAVVIFDPASGASDSIPLPLAPSALALSPDSLTAGVGHDAWISTVDLKSKVVLQTLPVPWPVHDIALAGNGYAYVLSSGAYYSYVMQSVNLVTGLYSSISGSYPQDLGVLPDGTAMYVAMSYSNGVNRYSLASGPAAFQWSDSNGTYFDPCGRIWSAEDGGRAFTGCGEALRLSPVQANDMVYAGTLAEIGYARVTALDHSSRAGRIAVVYTGYSSYGTPDPDTQLRIHDDVYLATQQVVTLPKFRVNTTDHPLYGKHVFLDASGTRMTSVAQLDAYAGVANDWFVIAY